MKILHQNCQQCRPVICGEGFGKEVVMSVTAGKLTHNANKTRLYVDLALFGAFLVVMSPHFSGMTIHEWLGISMGAGVIVHMLINWSWIVGITKRFFGKVTWSARLSYLLNVLLFINFVLVAFTGVMISEEALPLLGIQLAASGSWAMLHKLSAEVFPWLMGLHIAVHWHWIVNTIKRLLGTRRHATVPAPKLAHQEG